MSRSLQHVGMPLFFLVAAVGFSISIIASSCRNHVSGPDDPPLFLTTPGTRITESANADQIAWCANGVDIAFTSEDPSGPVLRGGLKSVNVITHSVRTLDGVQRIFNALTTCGDSVYYATLDVDNGLRVYVISGIGSNSTPVQISRGYTIVISPDRRLLAASPAYDTLEIVGLQGKPRTDFSLQQTDGPLIFSPDSRQVLLFMGRTLDISNGTFSPLPFPLPSGPFSLCWRQDGLFAVDMSQGDVYMMKNILAGTSTTLWTSPIHTMMAGGGDCIWSADGKKVAFMRVSTMDVYPATMYLYVCNTETDSSKLVMAVRGGTTRGTFTGVTSFALSPDGSKIAYAVQGDIYCSDL